jgi:diphosphomevalonate decarboxylase
MHAHPYAERRFAQAHDNLDQLIAIFGNLDEFIKVVESEALTLHAMMMTSMPYFILMKPNTWKSLMQFGNSVMTLKHQSVSHSMLGQMSMFYIPKTIEKVLQFIDELVGFCQNGQYICDEIGNGSIQLVNNDYLYVPLPFSGINLNPN